MKEIIERLVRLQEIGFELRAAEEERRRGPEALAAVDRAFEAQREEIGGERLRYEALVQELHRLREERERTRRRLELAQQKLMQVSNQREYSAVLNEIDSGKAHMIELEQAIETRESEIEELKGPAAEADERIAAAREQAEAEKRRIEQRIEELAGVIEELQRQQQELRSAIPPAVVARFEAIARARGGVALAAIVNDACGECRMRVRPQVINLVRRGAEIQICDSCRRILYIAPDEAPAEAGKRGAETSGD